MSSIRLTSLSDFSRHRYKVRIGCRSCKRVTPVDPVTLSALCREKGWSREVRVIETRLRCSQCGTRSARLGPGSAI